ncbi:MAG: 4-hydroxy-tetrahydrodipicolinate synthase [Bacteroidetes bacterium RIFCSPLOWO2_02_FULL_36_8]|nr:MAG: 4-hydroxy-tetrahydrodipicolinate synthase [Bacteroidetes bacterium RIFCSPLOWO2_02_FULL_36_8]OFY69035.1 MAG: 4-hydroxy-tetrahydrodipicolinate synthase [Bacteroidetes bacterium RIFCSPLOWO2_12_FULL_37_12]
MQNFTGTGVALVTPFLKNGEVDYKSFGKLLEHVLSGKVNFLVVFGTTGESSVLTYDEKRKIFNYLKQIVKKQLPIVYGAGGNFTSSLLKEISSNPDIKNSDAILSVCPYYNKPSQEGLYKHFNAIAAISPVPVILYNVPSRTASNLHYTTSVRLSSHPNIIGIKEASTDIYQCMNIVKATKKTDFIVLSGDDTFTLPGISIGMNGVISVLANALPEKFSAMTNFALASNRIKSSSIMHELLPFCESIYEEGNPSGIKELLSQLGICNNVVRLPLTGISKKLSKRIKGLLN